MIPHPPHAAPGSPAPRYDRRGGGGTMRRLLRWTFNTLAAASLLLCLATAGLWVRSYWVCDEFIAQRREASEDDPSFDVRRHWCYFVSYRGQAAAGFGWS